MKEKSICKAKLENGKIVFYDLCGESINDYTDVENKEYLGKGTIYEVNGVRQSYRSRTFLEIHYSTRK